jgi:hypothetical protein
MNTRLKKIQLSSKAMTNTAGGTLSWEIPKTGILAGMYLDIRLSLTGTPSATSLNAYGLAAAISRVRLIANAGINLIDVSGVGYHYGMRDFIEHNVDPSAASVGRDAITSGALKNLSMYFPVALNSRDPLGLIMLQNEDTQLRLEVEVPATSVLNNDFSAITVTVVPMLDIFTVPLDKKDWPNFDFAHTWNEEQAIVAAAGTITYNWPRGNIYASVVHLLGVGATGADDWTDCSLRVNQSEYLYNQVIPGLMDLEFYRFHGRARELGMIAFDFLSQSGLGNYGSGRDLLDSRQLTDISSVLTASTANTLFTVKRQLVPLRQG